MDLTASIAPKSDQLSADDLIGGPITVTITDVRAGDDEQPVAVHLDERPGRPYKPSKSMRRVMVAAWGIEASKYTGRRLRLYRNPDIKFGGVVVGGIEISHLSHIDGRLTIPLTVTRGKKRMHVVHPLPDAAPATFTIPDLGTVEAYREHYMRRQSEGAPTGELVAIRTAADAVASDGGQP